MKGITYQKFTGEPIASKFEAWKRLKEGNGVRVLGEYGFMDIVANRSISPYIVGTTPFDNAGIVLNYAAGVVSTERSEEDLDRALHAIQATLQ